VNVRQLSHVKGPRLGRFPRFENEASTSCRQQQGHVTHSFISPLDSISPTDSSTVLLNSKNLQSNELRAWPDVKMPEIAEGKCSLIMFPAMADLSHLVARIVHHLRKSLVGKTLSVVKAQDDSNVFGKVGTSGAEFQKSLTGKKVLDAGRQGKYFWEANSLLLLFYLANYLKANHVIATSSGVSLRNDR
jgi:Formamidopyrimidine-DNA glycosylase N-terminal domain